VELWPFMEIHLALAGAAAYIGMSQLLARSGPS
jgi:hypothetical protein